MGCSNGVESFFGNSHIDEISLLSDQHRIPLNAMIELTYKCNVDCVHCYCQHLDEPKTRPELTTKEWKSVLDQMADLGVLFLTITGGEILVRKDFWEIANHAKKLKFALCLYTNGTLIDEENANKLAELGPYMIEISVLHSDPVKHDLLAQKKGSFERIMQGVKRLKERNLRFLFKTTLLKGNINQTKEMTTLGKKVGAVEFEFGTDMSPKNDANWNPLKFEPSKEEMFDYLVGKEPLEWDVLPDLSQEELQAKGSCGAAQNGLALNPYGDILPCIQLMMPLNNIKAASLKEAWNNPPKAIEHIRKTNTYGDLPECKDCSILNFCRRCHGVAHLQTGRWDAKYEHGCEQAKVGKKVNEFVKSQGKMAHPYRNNEEGKQGVTESVKGFSQMKSDCCGGECS